MSSDSYRGRIPLWPAFAFMGLGLVLLPGGEVWSYLGGVCMGIALAMPKGIYGG